MTLQHINADTLGLKLATTTVHIKHDGTIRVGDRSTEGPGEYDIAGVGIHVFDHAAVIFTEGMRVAVLWGGTSLDLEEGVTLDIFIPLLPDAEKVTQVIKEQDPRLLILHDEAVADALAKQDGIEITRSASYKATLQTLPAGERSIILLA